MRTSMWRHPMSLVPLAGLMTAIGFSGCSSEEPPSPEPLATTTANLSALDGDLCMGEVWALIGNHKQGLQCTANDVELTELVEVKTLDDGCAFPGDTITMDAVFRVRLNAEHRYDIGLYFSENGTSALTSTALGGCRAHTLLRSEAQDREAGVPDTGKYCSGGLSHACHDNDDCPPGETCRQTTAEDTCGDMSQGEILTTVKDLTVVCKDDDLDSLMDFVYCSSWRQDGANDLCTTPYAAYPGAPSKCNCEGLGTTIVVHDPCKDVACDAKECNGPGTCDPTRVRQGLSGQGLCVYEPVSGGACTDDGNVCTEDTCEAGACAHAPVDGGACGTNTECTTGVCAAGVCAQVEIAGACDDGVACTDDACVAGACVNIADDDHCNDGVDCTIDVCDGKTGCSNTTVDDACDDKVDCTTNVCTATGCEFIPEAKACDDGLPCTDDACVVGEGCSNEPHCDDGHACTSDVCTAQGCKFVPDHAACDDGVSCTVDSCGVDGCQHLLNDDACNDSNLCTIDVCTSTGCVSTPSAEACDDGLPCTVDACIGGSCSHTPDCDDGHACTYDVCTAEGCVHVPDHVACDDGVSCTVDSCGVNGCEHALNDDACSDSNLCTDDVCTSQGCVRTNNAATCYDDGDACTADVCAGGVCTHPDNGQCVEDLTCETAFALAAHAFCDEDVDGDGRREVRWGWYGVISAGTETVYPLYAGAAKCDPRRGTEVGYVSVSYDGETATFTLVGTGGFGFEESHVYASPDRMWTLAPGLFTSGAEADGIEGTVTHTVSGFGGEDLYFSVHAKTCGDYDGGGSGGGGPGGDVDPTGDVDPSGG